MTINDLIKAVRFLRRLSVGQMEATAHGDTAASTSKSSPLLAQSSLHETHQFFAVPSMAQIVWRCVHALQRSSFWLLPSLRIAASLVMAQLSQLALPSWMSMASSIGAHRSCVVAWVRATRVGIARTSSELAWWSSLISLTICLRITHFPDSSAQLAEHIHATLNELAHRWC